MSSLFHHEKLEKGFPADSREISIKEKDFSVFVTQGFHQGIAYQFDQAYNYQKNFITPTVEGYARITADVPNATTPWQMFVEISSGSGMLGTGRIYACTYVEIEKWELVRRHDLSGVVSSSGPEEGWRSALYSIDQVAYQMRENLIEPGEEHVY